ncbi:putative holin-like toxin [Brevibacillus laterosporus]
MSVYQSLMVMFGFGSFIIGLITLIIMILK